MIITTYYAILTLGYRSNVGCTVYGRGMPVSRCVGPEVDCSFADSYEVLEYQRDLSTLVRRFDAQPLPEIDRSLLVLRCPFSHPYLAEHFDYWECAYDFELCLRRHTICILVG